MNTTPTMPSSEARVPTAVPRRYLAQLCKHFQHKLPVVFDEGHMSPAGFKRTQETAKPLATLLHIEPEVLSFPRRGRSPASSLAIADRSR